MKGNVIKMKCNQRQMTTLLPFYVASRITMTTASAFMLRWNHSPMHLRIRAAHLHAALFYHFVDTSIHVLPARLPGAIWSSMFCQGEHRNVDWGLVAVEQNPNSLVGRQPALSAEPQSKRSAGRNCLLHFLQIKTCWF